LKITTDINITLEILVIETPVSLHVFVRESLEIVETVELVIDDVTSLILSQEVYA
jgi:hypothetical protein